MNSNPSYTAAFYWRSKHIEHRIHYEEFTNSNLFEARHEALEAAFKYEDDHINSKTWNAGFLVEVLFQFNDSRPLQIFGNPIHETLDALVVEAQYFMSNKLLGRSRLLKLKENIDKTDTYYPLDLTSWGKKIPKITTTEIQVLRPDIYPILWRTSMLYDGPFSSWV